MACGHGSTDRAAHALSNLREQRDPSLGPPRSAGAGPIKPERMERVFEPGPELAERSGEMPSRTPPQPVEPAPACEEAPPDQRAGRWPGRRGRLRARVLPLRGGDAGGGGLPHLARRGPGARRGGAAGRAALTCRRRDVKQCVNADFDRIARFVVAAQASFFVTTGVDRRRHRRRPEPAAPHVRRGVLRRRWRRSATGARRACCSGPPPSRPARWRSCRAPGPDPSCRAPCTRVLTALSVLGVGALLAPVHAETRRRRDAFARARRELASDALARAQSLEQIGSKVAHELKNPLTGVKALVQLGLRNPAEAPSHERLEVVEREVTRMQEILQNYLSFTRPLQARATRRRVELGPLVSDTLVVLSARADDARVRLYAQGDATLEADPRRLKEALLNLVANAIEATPARRRGRGRGAAGGRRGRDRGPRHRARDAGRDPERASARRSSRRATTAPASAWCSRAR